MRRRDLPQDLLHGSPKLRILLLPAALVLTVAVTGCGSDTAMEPFSPPDEVGPYAVGRTTFTLVDAGRGGRELPVDAWYPVDPEGADGSQPSLYQGTLQLWILQLTISTPSKLALDNPPVSRAQRFPLVIFSHGSGGLRYQSFFLAETLASHGFVVVAPDHMGNTLFDEIGGTSKPWTEMMVTRPLDVSFLITRMLDKNEDPREFFYGSIDPERIGACGHSFGGFTSLAMAAGFGADPQEGLGIQPPEDIEPLPPDSRVRAIAPIAPVSSWFGDSELAAIRVPTVLIGGTLDSRTPIEPENERPFELIPAPAFRADLDEAVHFSFSNSCDLIQVMVDRGIPRWLLDLLLGPSFGEPCGPPALDIEEAHRITNLYAVSHFKRFLKGDERYASFLTEAYAGQHEPVVTFYAKPF